MAKVTIQKGDTLWAIAKKYYGDGSRFGELMKANNITKAGARRLKPGTVIEVPGVEDEQVDVPLPRSRPKQQPPEGVPAGVGINKAAFGAAKGYPSYIDAIMGVAGQIARDDYPVGAGGARPNPTFNPGVIPGAGGPPAARSRPSESARQPRGSDRRGAPAEVTREGVELEQARLAAEQASARVDMETRMQRAAQGLLPEPVDTTGANSPFAISVEDLRKKLSLSPPTSPEIAEAAQLIPPATFLELDDIDFPPEKWAEYRQEVFFGGKLPEGQEEPQQQAQSGPVGATEFLGLNAPASPDDDSLAATFKGK